MREIRHINHKTNLITVLENTREDLAGAFTAEEFGGVLFFSGIFSTLMALGIYLAVFYLV